MYRFRAAVFATFLAAAVVGCGEDGGSSASAKPEEVTPDFAAKSADMMKNANSGMDPKALKKQPGGIPGAPGAAVAPKK
jgi:hypothetical protein